MKQLIACILLLLPAMSVIASAKRELQFENNSVKVWKTTLPPNDKLSLHRHDSPRIVVGLKGGTLFKVDENGQTSNLIFETGKAYWLPSDPKGRLHGDLNLSDKTVEVMVIELKNTTQE